MTRLQLEFIDRRQLPWAGLAFLALTAAWSAQVAADRFTLRDTFQRNQERVAALATSLSQKREQLARAKVNLTPANEQRRKEEKKISTALTYPWNRVLATIEQG